MLQINFSNFAFKVGAVLAGLLALDGDRARADVVLGRIRASGSDAYGTPMAMVVFHAMSGDIEQAADWFEKAIEERDPAVVGYLRVPMLKKLLASARWPALAKKLNLP